MTGNPVNVKIPEAYAPLFERWRYKVSYGGRGAGRSWSFARALILRALNEPVRILCAREFQNSIEESVHQLLKDQIALMGLSAYFDIQDKRIHGRWLHNNMNLPVRASFSFKGLRHNIDSAKSMEGIDIVWIEEAERTSRRSLEVLIPTVRKPGSEIWVTFNPYKEEDPIYDRFVVNTPPDTALMPTTYRDNPDFPDVLDEERVQMQRKDPNMYDHVWEGNPLRITEAQIFGKRWRVTAFDDKLADMADRVYFGADFGFAQDPSTLIRGFILSNKLFIQYEAWHIGVELDEMPGFYDQIPGARKWPIKADSARPETISHLRRRGFRIEGAKKWQGSIEDGIAHIKGYDEIIIHKRCVHTAEEFKKYEYKVDRITGEVLPIPLDRWNHCIDAIRYMLDGRIKSTGSAHTFARLAQ
mgnify:CR=1 FL=1